MLFTRNVVLFVCVLPALVIGLQVFLSMQENKWLGLLLPMLCALLSLTALRGIVVLPGESLWQVLPTVVLTVLAANVPTALLLGIYAALRHRRTKHRQLDKMNIQDLK